MAVAQRMLVLTACAVTLVVACADPDVYLRHAKGDGGADTGARPTGAAGTTGLAGTTGAAGTIGAAGTGSAAAGTSASSGAAGTRAAAGTSGAAGTLGAAGTNGAAGKAGAAGTNGAAGTTGAQAGTSGAAGGTGTCAGCTVVVMYSCLSDASDQASFVVNASNKGAAAFLLTDLKLRYWYTMDAGKEQEINCDTAQLMCGSLLISSNTVTPARPKANEYVEIGFKSGALDINGSTGMIQLRVHNKDYSPMNQADDYSLDCGGAKGVAHDSGKVTAYLKGVLVGGIEPN